jgi:surface antigen
MQSDGNLVEYTFANTPLWSSRTAGNSGAQADMQADGNLVVYNSAHKALWASGTNGNQNSYLAIQGDGNVVIYNTAHNAVWATNTPIIAGGTNDYPYATSTIDADDGWGFLARECTSFVAWRIRHNLKISDFTNGWRGGWFGNAGDWAANARNLGLVVNSTPAVDSVAVLPAGVDGAGSVGHVAFVLGVGNGTITVEDYNYADSYDGMQYYVYSQHTINTAGVSFIHFR